MNDPKKLIVDWWPPLALALVCIAAQALNGVEALRYERMLVGEQPWRLVSGQLVHLGWNHLLLNLAGLLMIWLLFGHTIQPWAWGAAFVMCSLAVSGGLYLRDTDLIWYVGLSGVLHGMLVIGALATLSSERYRALLLLTVVAAKLTMEQLSGASSATAELVGGAVIVNAHLYGALGGLACAPLVLLGRRFLQQGFRELR
ncbi:MAG TPA: rhombosortase [Gammaproteobacteria bacterium]